VQLGARGRRDEALQVRAPPGIAGPDGANPTSSAMPTHSPTRSSSDALGRIWTRPRRACLLPEDGAIQGRPVDAEVLGHRRHCGSWDGKEGSGGLDPRCRHDGGSPPTAPARAGGLGAGEGAVADELALEVRPGHRR